MVGGDWEHDPLTPLTRGRVAAMICRYMHIRSSVALAVLGPLERSSRRELEFRGVMLPGGGDLATVNGAEFVNMLKRADEYYAPAGEAASSSLPLGGGPGRGDRAQRGGMAPTAFGRPSPLPSPKGEGTGGPEFGRVWQLAAADLAGPARPPGRIRPALRSPQRPAAGPRPARSTPSRPRPSRSPAPVSGGPPVAAGHSSRWPRATC